MRTLTVGDTLYFTNYLGGTFTPCRVAGVGAWPAAELEVTLLDGSSSIVAPVEAFEFSEPSGLGLERLDTGWGAS